MNYTIEGKGPSPVSTDDVRARDAATRAAQAKYILPHVSRWMDADFVADVCGAIAVLVASIVSGVTVRNGDAKFYLHGGSIILKSESHDFSMNVCDPGDAAVELVRGLGLEHDTALDAWNAIVPLLRGANGVLDGITLTDDPSDAAIVHCTITERP